jgi:hypothetical protein
MKHFFEASLFFPEWITPWIGLAAAAAAILGMKKAATTLGLFWGIEVFAMPILEPWLSELPMWVLAIALLILPLLMLHGFISFIFGKETAGHFTGTWLLRIFDFLLLGPFRILRFLFMLFR